MCPIRIFFYYYSLVIACFVVINDLKITRLSYIIKLLPCSGEKLTKKSASDFVSAQDIVDELVYPIICGRLSVKWWGDCGNPIVRSTTGKSILACTRRTALYVAKTDIFRFFYPPKSVCRTRRYIFRGSHSPCTILKYVYFSFFAWNRLRYRFHNPATIATRIGFRRGAVDNLRD